ncbi:MAG TPA: GntR family transcriptional regulator [Anaerovoracaceae bacterium]|nr:GntR family transcriptional regulator [Anaerovoracaceae bacterium]
MDTLKRKPIEKRPLYREEIRSSIKKAIMTGELKPGDRIIETRWAKELGVSQSPVREAIRELEMIGLVENIPYQGCFVRKVTKKDMRDSYKVRMYLELLGIQDAVKNVDEKKIKELHSILKEMEVAAEQHNFDLYIQKDVYFHKKIIAISENDILLRSWEQCNIHDLTYIGTWISHLPLEQLSVRHEGLYEAIAARDTDQASAEISRHFEQLIDEMDLTEE